MTSIALQANLAGLLGCFAPMGFVLASFGRFAPFGFVFSTQNLNGFPQALCFALTFLVTSLHQAWRFELTFCSVFSQACNIF